MFATSMRLRYGYDLRAIYKALKEREESSGPQARVVSASGAPTRCRRRTQRCVAEGLGGYCQVEGAEADLTTRYG